MELETARGQPCTHTWVDPRGCPGSQSSKDVHLLQTTFTSSLLSTSLSPGLAPKYKLLSNVCSGDQLRSQDLTVGTSLF